MDEKKILLIFPPQWTPISPHYALPSLLGQLKTNGRSACAIDLNIEFFEYILNKEKIESSISLAKERFEENKKQILKIYSPSKKPADYSFEEQIALYQYSKFKAFFKDALPQAQKAAVTIDEAIKIIKGEEFYNPSKIIFALKTLDSALEAVSIPYCPSKIGFEGVQNPFFKFNYENIKYFVEDDNSNIFKEFYQSHIRKIIEKKPDFIGISINSSSQIVPGLTLSKMLKASLGAHINIGGNFFGRIADELKHHKEFFKTFAHSVSIEEGEETILEIAKYVNEEIDISNVHNLLYLKDDVVLQNEKMPPVKLNEVANADLSDYDLKKYYAPRIVLPYQASRGCYWGKCSFCDQDFGQNHSIKTADRVAAQFLELKQKYDIKDFEFIDESVSPAYLNELSKKIEENNLEVEFFMDARLEAGFTKEILQNAQKQGLRMVLWGLESGSRKVMELINKGVDFDKRFSILKNSAECGIWNFAFIFFGFPTETKSDAQMTIEMLVENKDIIHSYGRSVFTMGRHAKIAQEPKKYGITKIYPAEEEFSPNINFDCVGMSQKELKQMLENCLEKCAKAYKNPIWMYLRYREWLFLYISKYGAKKVKEMNID